MNTPTQTPQLAQTPAPVQISALNPVKKYFYTPTFTQTAISIPSFTPSSTPTPAFSSSSLSIPAPSLNVPQHEHFSPPTGGVFIAFP
jgi:hypothetical protein